MHISALLVVIADHSLQIILFFFCIRKNESEYIQSNHAKHLKLQKDSNFPLKRKVLYPNQTQTPFNDSKNW